MICNKTIIKILKENLCSFIFFVYYYLTFNKITEFDIFFRLSFQGQILDRHTLKSSSKDSSHD